MSQRKFFVGGNWKMNGSKEFIDSIIEFLKHGPLAENVEVVVAPPAVYISYTKERIPANIAIAGQNSYKEAKGAFTGELSPAMLRDVGCKWVILGHSERRHIFGESDDLVGEKTKHAISAGVGVILCIGEKLDEREANKTQEVCYRQLQAVINQGGIDWTSVVVAYEPVWAIGTGKTATPEQAQEAHEWVRHWIAEKVNPQTAAAVRIIYGGSVTAENCRTLGEKPDIDGFLVGGASLKPDFVKIVNARA